MGLLDSFFILKFSIYCVFCFIIFIILFIYLAAPRWHESSSIFTGACGIFSCSMWDLVPLPGIELRLPALGNMDSWPLGHQESLWGVFYTDLLSVLRHVSHVRLSAIPWTVACQVPLSVGFSRQEDWSGLLFPYPGNLPNPWIALHANSLPQSHWGSRLHDNTSQVQPAVFQVLCLLKRCIIHFVII